MAKNSSRLIAFMVAFILTACGSENSNTTTDGAALKQREPTVGSMTGPVLAPSSSTGSITLATQANDGRYGYPASGIVSASTNWHVEYYNSNPGFTWYSQAIREVLPDNAMYLNQNFGNGGPRVSWGSVNSDFFTARYTSQIYVSNPGTLYFRGNSDDGMRLYLYRLDGKNFGNVDPNDYQRYPSQTLWEHWYRKPADPARPYAASQYVTPGLYGITVEYYEFDGLASVEMSISGNGSVVTPPPPPPPPPGNNGGGNNGGGNQETPRPSCANTDKWYANFYSGDILSGGSWRDSTPLSQISATYAGSELSQFRTNWDNDGNPGQDTGQPILRFNSHEMGPNSGVYTATFSTVLPGHGRYRVTLGVKGFAKGSIRLFEGETVRNKDVKPSQDNQSKSSMSWSKQEYNIQGCRQIVVKYVDYAPGQGRDANNADLTVSFTKL